MPNVVKRVIGCLAALVIVAVLFSSSVFEPVKLIYPVADIVDIQAVSDTSVVVRIDTYKNSNANSCRLMLSVDTVSGRGFGAERWETRDCDLAPRYDVGNFRFEERQALLLRIAGWRHV